MNCVLKIDSTKSFANLFFKLLPYSYPVRNNEGKKLLDLVQDKIAKDPSFAAIDHAVKTWERQWATATVASILSQRYKFPPKVLRLVHDFISTTGKFEPTLAVATPLEDEDDDQLVSNSFHTYSAGDFFGFSSFFSDAQSSSSLAVIFIANLAMYIKYIKSKAQVFI